MVDQQVASGTDAVRVRGVVKTYGRGAQRTRALDGVDLTVRTGSVHAVLGPNGAGKTTLVRLLATLLRPDAGTVEVLGTDVVADPRTVRARIGLTGQYASVDDLLTARENLVLFARLLGLGRAEARVRADELLARFGLEDAARRGVGTFSGGMRRRLDIAASLLARPPLVFLDEPTTGLDPRTRQQMWGTVRGLVEAGTTVLLTTQYLEEADVLADRVTVVDRGQVVADDSPDALKRSVGGPTLQVVVRAPEQVEDAVRALAAVTGGVPDRAGRAGSPEAAPGRLTVPVADEGVLGAVVARLHADRIAVDEVGVRRPTLDEVFLALTGDGAAARTEVPA